MQRGGQGAAQRLSCKEGKEPENCYFFNVSLLNLRFIPLVISVRDFFAAWSHQLNLFSKIFAEKGKPLLCYGDWTLRRAVSKKKKKLSLVLIEIDLRPYYLGERSSWFRTGVLASQIKVPSDI